MLTFDECYQTFPELTTPDDFEEFWKASIKELKSFPIKLEDTVPLKGQHLKETVHSISFQGYLNYKISGNLVIPRKRGDLPVVVFFHDYNENKPAIWPELTHLGFAQLSVHLRGHGDQLIKPQLATEDDLWSPGYFTDGIEKPDTFYMKYLFLDVLRTIEFLRLTKGIDSENIYLHGKNLGAALAVFGAAFSKRVKGIFLETPGFSHLSVEQLKSDAAWAKEINSYLHDLTPAKKTKIKKQLAYFDVLNMAEKISIPALVSCGLKDNISTPKSVFALFNRLSVEKQMHLYPDQGNDYAVAEQKKKNIEFLKEITNWK